MLSLSHNVLSSLVGMPRSMDQLNLLSLSHNEVSWPSLQRWPLLAHAADYDLLATLRCYR